MNFTFLTYLFELSISLVLFTGLYRLLISRLTLFGWMRFFLLGTLILSIFLPLIHLPVHWNTADTFFRQSLAYSPMEKGFGAGIGSGTVDSSLPARWPGLLLTGLLAVYWIGVVFNAFIFSGSLKWIISYIKRSKPVSEGQYHVIEMTEVKPAFSFLNYLFLNKSYGSLNNRELQQVKDHELVHISQHHTLDILFIEFISVFLWFHPLMRYIKRSLGEIHEFIADEKTAGSGMQRRDYAGLLLTLTSGSREFRFSAGFAASQIKRRIIMLNTPRSNPVRKVLFSAVVPMAVFLMLSFSFIDGTSSQIGGKDEKDTVADQEVLGIVHWSGNKVYDTGRLNEAFGLKQGDRYDSLEVFNRLKISGIADLYLNNGYVFFRADYTEERHDGAVDLSISVYEGMIARMGNVLIRSDKTLPEEIKTLNNIHPGDLFSKAEIIKLVRALGNTGKFDKEKINPRPVVNDEKSTEEYAVIDLIVELKGI